jgi:hypothetical protein
MRWSWFFADEKIPPGWRDFGDFKKKTKLTGVCSSQRGGA